MNTGCAPWWFEEDECCLFCLQGYADGAEYRCQRCDAAVCPHCVVVIGKSRAIYCPQCRPGRTVQPSSAAAESMPSSQRRSHHPTR
jgi:DNA-directed RNA polymerase subunit RPC12/RpoP